MCKLFSFLGTDKATAVLQSFLLLDYKGNWAEPLLISPNKKKEKKRNKWLMLWCSEFFFFLKVRLCSRQWSCPVHNGVQKQKAETGRDIPTWNSPANWNGDICVKWKKVQQGTRLLSLFGAGPESGHHLPSSLGVYWGWHHEFLFLVLLEKIVCLSMAVESCDLIPIESSRIWRLQISNSIINLWEGNLYQILYELIWFEFYGLRS